MEKNTDHHDSTVELNWLEHWDGIPFVSDPDDDRKIKLLKRKLRVYVRGELAEYNSENERNFVVKKFEFDRKSRVPLEYTVKAFLEPPVEHGADEDPEAGGGHLIPPSPPPPDEIK